MLASLLAAISAFAVFLLATGIVVRVFKVSARIKVMALTLALCAPLVPFFLKFFAQAALVNLIPAAAQTALLTIFVFAFLSYAYLQFFGVIEGSITLRSLILFREASAETLTVAQFKKAYSFQEIIRKKAALMPEMGLAVALEQNGEPGLMSTAKGRLMGKAFLAASDLYRWGAR